MVDFLLPTAGILFCFNFPTRALMSARLIYWGYRMKKTRLRAATALATSILVLTSAPAWAQDAAPPAADAEEGGDEIVVTGSLIANPNLEKSSPVNVILRGSSWSWE
jgi:hypothetical protein